jgi:hypothetical protein
VRWPIFLWLTFFCFAQNQERTLIDRLLRPDMELQNGAQSKKFGANSKIVERRGTVGTFVLQPSINERAFGARRVVATAEYHDRQFQLDPRSALAKQSRDANVAATTNTSPVRDVHEIYDSHRQVAGRNFADERSFHDEGKSQKSLDRQNPPLTIEQVRELLNKNK